MARPAYAYAAGAVVNTHPNGFELVAYEPRGVVVLLVTCDEIRIKNVTCGIGGEVLYKASGPASFSASASKTYTGMKVKITDRKTGKILFEGHNATITQMTGDVSATGCNHDIKVYDSGFTKERYCTKCTWKEKL